MSTADCLRIIREAAGEDLSDKELDDLFTELQKRARANQASSKLETLEEDLFNAAEEIAVDAEIAAVIERRNALINIKVFNDLMNFIDEADRVMDSPALGVEARTVGVNAPIPGGRLSADARFKAMRSEYLLGMAADLEQGKLLPYVNSKGMDREIARELAELTKPGGQPGRTGVKEAAAIAKIIDKYRNVAIQRENRAGAFIRKLPGYITRQSHDMVSISRAGFDEWYNFIINKLDNDRTFGDADPKEFLKAAYDGIVTGRHIKAAGQEESDLKFIFKGPKNLAKRASEHRVLHFKDADAWFDYNERFGQGHVMESIVHELERAARNTALMEMFGPNPRAMFDRVMDAQLDKHRGNLKKFKKLKSSQLQHQFSHIDGTTRIPVAPSAARVYANVRAFISWAKLGGAVLSAAPDVVSKMLEIRRTTGRSILDSWGQSLKTFADGLPTEIRKQTLYRIGVGADGMLGDIASRWSATDGIAGNVAKTQQFYYKLNLLGPWTDSHKAGLGSLFAHDFATKKNMAWDGFHPRLKAMLNRYEIGEREWELGKKAIRKESDGNEYLMPDGIQELSDADVRAYLNNPKASARTIQKAKDRVETSFRAFYTDRADYAVPTPGAREQAIMQQGTQPGTPTGEAWRFMMQFKAFPITVLTKVVGAELYGGGAKTLRDAILKGQGDLLGLAHLIVSSTILGYVAQSAKEMAKGRTPRDPADPATWTAAFLQGGGAGIYGDFLFGEYNRFGRSALATAAGPAASTIDDAMELWARFRNGEDFAAGAFRFALSNAPFINLFYTRAALDYLIIYQMQEALNPGYLKRMESTMLRENSTSFVIPPSQIIPRGGGNRLLEGVR